MFKVKSRLRTTAGFTEITMEEELDETLDLDEEEAEEESVYDEDGYDE